VILRSLYNDKAMTKTQTNKEYNSKS